ncbi:MAG TPA: DUF2782 domain-containing protein, partial [Rudaea sp.]
GFAAAVCAQSDKSATTIPPVQPPPDMDERTIDAPAGKSDTFHGDPRANAPTIPLANSEAEAKAAAEAEAKATAEREKALRNPDLKPASKPLDSPGLPPDVQRAAEATELPVVTVRQNGNETVKEYRKKGVLYFVSVSSETGPTKLYVDNPNDVPPDVMRQLGGPATTKPVYYKLLEWK